MLDISGIELCQRIRRDFQQFYAYIILLTSNTEKEKVIEGLAAGADDYLTKPFHPGELLARVGVGCRIVELHHQLQVKNRLLEELALTDALTGLPNRRAIDEWASRQLSAAARHNFPIWVVMADLDHFKKINDTHGHEAGDTVLKSFDDSQGKYPSIQYLWSSRRGGIPCGDYACRQARCHDCRRSHTQTI
jgi:two-component system, cell cycle response regulator